MGGREPRRGGAELRAGLAAPPRDARGTRAQAGSSERGSASDDGAAGARRHWAEELAERALVAEGYEVLSRNYRLRGGEIDLVCRGPDGTVVFVEVRQRRSPSHGGAGESLSAAKLRRVRRAAARFLAAELGRPEAPVRFDAVLVLGDGPRPVVRHLEDAF